MNFIDETQEGASAVVQVREGVFGFRRAERMNVETDVFAVAAVFVAFEDAHLIESAAEVCAAERFVLVEFQAVLVVEMERPELAEGHREIDFVGRIESGKDRVS